MNLALLIILLLAPLTNLAAEETWIEHEARVRVMAPSFVADRLIGKLIAADADTLVMHLKARAIAVTVPLDSITKFEVSRDVLFGERWEEVPLPVKLGVRRGGSRGKNALIGAGIGMLVSAVGAYNSELPDECETPDPDQELCFTKSDAFVIGTVVIGVPLAVLGAVIGAATPPGERWEEVPLRPQVGFSPHGGVRVALRFEFGR